MDFSSAANYNEWLDSQAALPAGFEVATSTFEFMPAERARKVPMTLTLLALAQSTQSFAGMFTQNRFPGAPVIIGRKRMAQKSIRAVIINNKISNVGVRTGVDDSERLCAALASQLQCTPAEIIPASTGIIGWRLPVEAMCERLPSLLTARQQASILPAARGIMTTDLYPKIRRASVGAGTIVAIAKGAGMIEPNLATMLVFILTDIAIGQADLRAELERAVIESFNCISVDSDQSTSDTVLLLSSQRVQGVAVKDFTRELRSLCKELAMDIVRNGEGVHHVLEVDVRGAPDAALARNLGRTIIRSPLIKTAICGNDPNVGRIMMAVGNFCAQNNVVLDYSKLSVKLGEEEIFSKGGFELSQDKEAHLAEYLKCAELYCSAPNAKGEFHPTVNYPPHQRNVKLTLDLHLGHECALTWGGDLSHEYVTENADYRS